VETRGYFAHGTVRLSACGRLAAAFYILADASNTISEEYVMTPRERIQAAFQHQEPDRTPIFEREVKYPTDDRVLGRPAVHPYNWPEYMREWAREGWQATMERYADDELEIAQLLGFDMIRLMTNPPSSAPRPVEIDAYTFRQGNSTMRYHVESGVVETIGAKNRDPVVWEREFREQIERDYAAPCVRDDQLFVWRRIRQSIERRGLDLAVYVSLYAIPVAALPPFALEWFLTEPCLIERYYAKQSRWIIDMARVYAAEGVDVAGLGGDFAGDTGPVISPRAYREHVVPHIRRQADAIRAMGVWTTNTTDGYLWDVLPDFLDASGVDGYGEIDIAAGMDLARLKSEWGDRYTFLGNLDIRWVLCDGTIEEARNEMERCIRQGWGNGGHVIMTSNVVHEDVRPDLYLAAIDRYREYFALPPLERR
jgi:hypothetical protein